MSHLPCLSATTVLPELCLIAPNPPFSICGFSTRDNRMPQGLAFLCVTREWGLCYTQNKASAVVFSIECTSVANPAESVGKDAVSGIILAGGRSRRLGRDKAVEPFEGQPLIRRVIERIQPLTGEIVVVVADAARGDGLPLEKSERVAVDLYPGGGSLGGIFSGLSAANGQWGLVVACDMPFLNRELFEHMLTLREGWDAVVPMPGDFPEPTHALYSRVCLSHIEAKLKANDLKISGFFDDVRVRYVHQEDVRTFDPELHSFFNVNSPEDLAQAVALSGG